MAKRDLLSIVDLSPSELERLLALALDLKRGKSRASLAGRSLVMLLEKPSLRTRISFELAMRQLQGTTISMSQNEVGLGSREAVSDAAQVLSRYVDVIAARVYSHATLEELGRWASVPVINALSDYEHPCQALADLLTIYERKGRLQGVTLAYVGDGNNVAASLALASSLAGCRFRIATPPGYALLASAVQQAHEIGGRVGTTVQECSSPEEAVASADVVYTDVWVSMGQEAETERRRQAFQGYQVTAELLARAAPDALFLHPLPAHHGEEIAEGLLDHPRSVVFDQAENRLHAQKALLAFLLNAEVE